MDEVKETILDRNIEGQGQKFDGGKPRLDLIPSEVIFALGNILEYGGRKYGDRNWEKGMELDRIYGAAMRHLWAYWGGEYTDEESGRPHLYSALANISFLITYHERGLGGDTPSKSLAKES